MQDPAALLASVENLATKIKKCNGSWRCSEAIANVDTVLDEMIESFETASNEFGNEDGGELVKAITERFIELGTGTVLNCLDANHFEKTITGATTLSLNKLPPAGVVYTMVLHLVNAGTRVTFWNGIQWSEGIKPELAAAGRDVIAFSTRNGGASWDGYLLGKTMKAASV